MISESLHCRSCGYNLRGLAANGRCPECGVEIWESVSATVDPAAARLPSLRNPRAVGNALVLLTLCMFCGTLLLVLPSLHAVIDAWESIDMNTHWLPTMTWQWAAALAVLGLAALWMVAPPRGSEPRGAIWNDIWRIGLGLTGWLAFSMLWIELSASPLGPRSGPPQKVALHLAAAVFATIGLIGLRGVFRVIGQRSREYRRSQGGRQSIELLIIAISVAWAAELTHYATLLNWFPGRWRGDVRTLATVIMWISSLMVIIGLAYLVLNALWIRRSLRKPPPALDQVLVPHVPSDLWIPDREE